jgi:hypothetical protein
MTKWTNRKNDRQVQEREGKEKREGCKGEE